MDESEGPDETTLKGRVKWFDPTRGFGFVVSEAGGPDILLHANVLRNFGQGSVADGSHIELVAQQTGRGLQAVRIVEIAPPPTAEMAVLPDLAAIDDETLAAAELEPARVKWFDKGKGFGFANVFGLDGDVFIHVEVLRKSGLADLQPGEAVGLRAIEGRRGRMAVEVTAWDAALRTR